MTGERPFLLPAAWLYGGIVALRNAAFNAGLFPARGVGVPVISLGNISAGGTGKTPLTEEAARVLREHRIRAGVLSRGYGRRTTGFRWVQRDDRTDTDASLCGDEPVQIALNLPGTQVAVDADRVAGARRMVSEAGIEVIILDDGFQHRWIRRSRDIVVVRSDEVIMDDRLLPAGKLREPVSSLKRASLVVVSGCDDETDCDSAGAVVARHTDAEVACMKLRLIGVREIGTEDEVGLSALSGARVVAVSGIGQPRSFHATLRENGISVVSSLVYGDHHAFTEDDSAAMHRALTSSSADAVIMTQKDAVRLRGEHLPALVAGTRAYYTIVRPDWIRGADRFTHHVLGAVRETGEED